MSEPVIDRDQVLQQLDRVLSSSVFRRAERSTALLRFIVEQTLQGHADRLKEYTLGAAGLGRGDTFDPRADPVVRAEASRLRARLEQYYEASGRDDPVLIALPKGSYVPQFLPNAVPAPGGTVSVKRSGRFRFARSPVVAWTAASVLALIAALAWLRVPPPPPPRPPGQFEVELEADDLLPSDVGTTVVLSEDGTRMAFVSRAADERAHARPIGHDSPRGDRGRSRSVPVARRPMDWLLGRWPVEEDCRRWGSPCRAL